MKYLTDKIIRQMAMFLGREDIYNKYCNDEPFDVYVYEPETTLMLECINLTVFDIAEQHFPLTRVESYVSNSLCQVSLSSFDKTVYRIVDVYDSKGRKTTFRTFDEFIKLCEPDSKFEFVYEYLPERAKGMGKYVEAVSMVTERVIALGACAVFCLANGLYDEAKLWDLRFNEAIDKIKNKSRRETRMPPASF